ncbi:MAG: NADPH-dependent glutamate synthase [Elusimicrobiota bacterium]|nr:NADPH-dependent glutamate synthase [Elusimicrobiota bacterium]
MGVQKKRTPVNKRTAEERKKDFNEVSSGYSAEEALQEARRCLMCPDKPCVEGCPVGIDIPAFIQSIIDGDLKEGFDTILKSNALPGVCGRVCPQEDQCALVCVMGKKFEPVNIGALERYISDSAVEKGFVAQKSGKEGRYKESIGVVGSGPAGLTIAGDMLKYGYKVTLYEALHEPGGVLRYGIPEFRLSNDVIDREVENLVSMGLNLKLNYVIGKILSLEELRQKHNAVFLGIGAGLPRFMGIEGENLNGVYSANEYLTRNNLMRSYQYPEYNTPVKKGDSVAVVGGGNVAMDSARSAVRLGAENVYNIYRRSRVEMPAREEEIENAVEEGVRLQFLRNPVKITGDKNKKVIKIRCIKMELGAPDESGRRRPLPVEGSEYDIDVDVVVMAIGTGPNRVLLESTPGLELNKWGYITTDEETGMTNIDRVYAGGDIVTGGATVISAMGAARKAGNSIRKNWENG